MLVTIVTTWFPTAARPAVGPFVLRDARAIAATSGSRVRVVHLIPPSDLAADGGAARIAVPVRAQSALPAAREGTGADEGSIEVLRIPFAPQDPRTWAGARAPLAAALRGSDAVHSMAISSLLALRMVQVPAPWVHTEHWSALTTPASAPAHLRAAIPVFRRLLRRPDTVTAVCEFLAAPIRAERGPRPVAVVPCIVDPVPLTPRRDRSDGTLRLVSTGALIERKDPLVAVRVVAELARRGVDARLDWLGDGPLRSATEEEARALGIADRITLRGQVAADEVLRTVAEGTDLFFGPTRADNFFVGAAEALVAGRPVVLGATGGQGEYVDPAVGELVGVQDPRAYADAIQRVDAATRDLSSEQISETIGERFSTPVVGAQYREVLEETCERGSGPRVWTGRA
ncbi:glycosyltransferase [Brachybacterium sp. JHP9]|uniref:Glycosyltransferase n=1 Tax=Brachybacterium equifaecis TaxID=2910770 RepID=A0ABT0R2W8_9MICO|nr:glycosyltransferase [Brachybacterium equifaecis]